MSVNEKKTLSIKEIVASLINKDKSVEDNVKSLVDAFDKGKFGRYTIGELQDHLGQYYIPFVRTIHLR